jgi:hypothetical protein
MVIATREEGLAFVLPWDVARAIPGAHVSPVSWAKKARKASGRAVIDSSSTNNGKSSALNTDAVVSEAESTWGPISHPTVGDVARMALQHVRQVQRQHGLTEDQAWRDAILWKTDLRGAFTLMDIKPEDAAKFMTRLSGGLALIFCCGVFGWCGTPFPFQAVSRTLAFELALVLLGLVLIYVDDAMGICRRQDLQREMAAAKRVMRALLGDGAVAEDKDASGRAIDDIGYRMDLDARRVGISERNLYSAIHAFLTIDVDGEVTMLQMERAASLASRYSDIIRVLSPFSGALYASYAGRVRCNAKFPLRQEARLAVRLWRVALCASFLRHGAFTRLMTSFEPNFRGLVAEFDASLSGVGIVFYERDAQGHESPVGGAAVSIEFLGFGDESALQNCAEFIGAVLCAAGALKLGRRGESIELRGDSISALTWASEERFRGWRATSAAVVFTQLAAAGQLDAIGSHIGAGANGRTDLLSRRYLWKGECTVRSVIDSFGEAFRGVPVIELEEDDRVMGLLRLCRPLQDFGTDDQFMSMWREVAAAARALSE